MTETIINIKNLHAQIDVDGKPKEILKGLNLEIKAGEVHAIMGPNGSGKSTLSKVLAGHPDYEITEGSIDFHGKSLLDLEPDARANSGLFLAFQYPVEFPGVNNLSFLRMSYNSKQKFLGKEEMDPLDFDDFIEEKINILKMNSSFLDRNLNEGFSGGEKKKNEILQMLVLNPSLAILDETDSGLDIDALRIVADGINTFKSKKNAVLLITHYQRLLDYVQPDFVHVLAHGVIQKTGDKNLALELEKSGYATSK
jgi:Fe-S cluster assembly ATP-binding protein